MSIVVLIFHTNRKIGVFCSLEDTPRNHESHDLNNGGSSSSFSVNDVIVSSENMDSLKKDLNHPKFSKGEVQETLVRFILICHTWRNHQLYLLCV